MDLVEARRRLELEHGDAEIEFIDGPEPRFEIGGPFGRVGWHSFSDGTLGPLIAVRREKAGPPPPPRWTSI